MWKELLEHLRSLRFAVSLVTIFGLFVLGATVWNVRIAEQRVGYGLAVEEYEESIRAAEDVAALEASTLYLWLPPAGLTFACCGYSHGLPNVADMRAHGFGIAFEQRADRNPMLFRNAPDWIFIAGTLGTLMALLLTYDGVAGEKERGCLRQLLANRVPRDQVLMAKYLAGLAMAAAAILTGAGAAVTIIQLNGEGRLGDVWITLAAVMIAALLCVSAFLWLGLWASSRTHNSALALLVSLVVWALLAVFLPQAGILAGDYLVDVPSYSAARSASFKAGGGEGYFESVRLINRAQQHYRTLLLHQVEVARNTTLVSPVAALSLVSEALTVTGVVRHRAFVKQAYDHRQEFADFLRREGFEHPRLRILGGNYRTEPVSQEEVPRFQFRPPGLRERLDASLAPLLVLVIANGVCFVGAYFSFRRYDVR